MNEQYGQLIEPPAQRFSFGAPGWYVLAALVLLALIAVSWLVMRAYHRNEYRRRTLKAIATMVELYRGRGLLYSINMLLKRVAMTRYGRRETAGVREEAWIAFLNHSRGKRIFDRSDVCLLAELYNRKADYTLLNDFVTKAKDWVRKHKRIKSSHEPLRDSV